MIQDFDGMKDYIGDGLYVRFDGFGIEVTSENGIDVLNTIYLEPDVLAALNRFARRTKEASL